MHKNQKNYYGINENNALDNILLLIRNIKSTRNDTTKILADGKSS